MKLAKFLLKEGKWKYYGPALFFVVLTVLDQIVLVLPLGSESEIMALVADPTYFQDYFSLWYYITFLPLVVVSTLSISMGGVFGRNTEEREYFLSLPFSRREFFWTRYWLGVLLHASFLLIPVVVFRLTFEKSMFAALLTVLGGDLGPTATYEYGTFVVGFFSMLGVWALAYLAYTLDYIIYTFVRSLQTAHILAFSVCLGFVLVGILTSPFVSTGASSVYRFFNGFSPFYLFLVAISLFGGIFLAWVGSALFERGDVL